MHGVHPEHTDLIQAEAARTLPGLFFERVRRSPEAIGFCEHRDGRWVQRSWAAMAQEVGRVRAALDRAGLRPGERVAVLLPNGMDWVAFDIGAMANGLITVPLYGHDSAGNNAFILRSAGARLCLMDRLDRWETLLPELGDDGALSAIWLKEGIDHAVADGERSLAPFSAVLGEDAVDDSEIRCSAGDVATLIHTSGTTGRPKGVMLTHAAILWNAEAVTKFIPPLTSDVFLSVLPLAHAFERTMGYYLPMMAGAQVAYARAIETLRDDIRLIRPTVLIAAPRLYERIHEAIWRKAAANPLTRWLMALAGSVGWRLHEAERGRAPPPDAVTRRLLWPLLQRFVARRILKAFGGRLRVAVSGGAPLSAEVSHFLLGIGLPLVEGYGLTEAAPVVTATTFEDRLPGSVGRPLHGLEVRLGEEDELLIRSPGIMQGYWGQPRETAAALSPEGWLRTGDIAEIREGRIFITGRLKELIVLSTGKKVAPTAVEAAIERAPLIEQACVVGDRQPCLVAIAVLNPEEWQKLARSLGVAESASDAPAAKQAALERIRQATRALPPFAQVRGVHLVRRPWSIEDGALTPTLKIKRRVIEDRYEREIDALYARLARERHDASPPA